MNNAIQLAKPIVLLTITAGITIFWVLLNSSSQHRDPMSRSFILWLHGLGDSGPANEPIKTFFKSPEFRNTVWSFPSAPSNPVTCNCKYFTVDLPISMFNYFSFFLGFCGVKFIFDLSTFVWFYNVFRLLRLILVYPEIQRKFIAP